VADTQVFIQLQWNAPACQVDAYCVYSSTNLNTPTTNWIKIATVIPPATNAFVPSIFGQNFFFVTTSNFWGEAQSNIANTPTAPTAVAMLHITGWNQQTY